MPITGFTIVTPAQAAPAEAAPAQPGTTVETQEGAPAEGGSRPPQGREPGLFGYMPMVLIFVIMYLLLIRPQQKRQKEQREMVSRLKVGDRVLTSAGIYGTITGVKDAAVTVEIAKGVEIEVLRGAIGNVIDAKDNKA
ncbi:MAG: preprotein translocase subunit YajC [Lentisphaeria bacterium]|jgi:preprotein translocase subunit YajC|nr:preprotein translocase subunit YajC [Lentisphaeria bacterium]